MPIQLNNRYINIFFKFENGLSILKIMQTKVCCGSSYFENILLTSEICTIVNRCIFLDTIFFGKFQHK